MDFAQLRERLRGVAEFQSVDGLESVQVLGEPLPEVTIHVRDVRRMLERFLSSEVSETEFAVWATVLTLLGCYEIEEEPGGNVTVAWSALHNFSAPTVSGALQRSNAEAWLQRLSLSGS
jgi:hypothetical protein